MYDPCRLRGSVSEQIASQERGGSAGACCAHQAGRARQERAEQKRVMVNVSSKYEASDTGRSVARDTNKRAEGGKRAQSAADGRQVVRPSGQARQLAHALGGCGIAPRHTAAFLQAGNNTVGADASRAWK